MKNNKIYLVLRGYEYGSNDIIAAFETYLDAKRSSAILNKIYKVKGREKFFVRAEPLLDKPLTCSEK